VTSDAEVFTLVPPEARVTRHVLSHQIRVFRVFEVMEVDLEALEDAYGQEATRLAFMTTCGGALVSCVLSWIGAASLSPLAAGLYAGVSVALTVITALCAILWVQARRVRPEILKRIRTACGAAGREGGE